MCEAEHLFMLLRSIYIFCVCELSIHAFPPIFCHLSLFSPLNIYLFKYSFIYLAVFDLSHSTQDLQSSLGPVGSSSLTRNRTQPPALGAQSPSHWTTRQVPPLSVSYTLNIIDETVPIFLLFVMKQDFLKH